MKKTDYLLSERIDGLAFDGSGFVALHMGVNTLDGEPPATYHHVHSGRTELVLPEPGQHWYSRFTRRFAQEDVRRIGPWGFSAMNMVAVVPTKTTKSAVLSTLERTFRIKLIPYRLNLFSFGRGRCFQLPGKPEKAHCVFVCPSTDVRRIAVGAGRHLRVYEPEPIKET